MYWNALHDLIIVLLQRFEVNMLCVHEGSISFSFKSYISSSITYLSLKLHFKKLKLCRLLYIIPFLMYLKPNLVLLNINEVEWWLIWEKNIWEIIPGNIQLSPLGTSRNIHSQCWFRKGKRSPKSELGTHFLEAVLYIVYDFYTWVSTTNLTIKWTF